MVVAITSAAAGQQQLGRQTSQHVAIAQNFTVT
jgi:hypothetical protein